MKKRPMSGKDWLTLVVVCAAVSLTLAASVYLVWLEIAWRLAIIHGAKP